MSISQFIHSTVDRHLDYFQPFTSINNVATNIFIHVPVHEFLSGRRVELLGHRACVPLSSFSAVIFGGKPFFTFSNFNFCAFVPVFLSLCSSVFFLCSYNTLSALILASSPAYSLPSIVNNCFFS